MVMLPARLLSGGFEVTNKATVNVMAQNLTDQGKNKIQLIALGSLLSCAD